jgi:hypothetical protein
MVCDAPKKGFMGVDCTDVSKPWSVLKRDSFDDCHVCFSDGASDLMASRARATWTVFRARCDELTDFAPHALVKLRFQVTDANTEHLWFTVAGATEATVDATLIHEPWADIGLRKGDRRVHDLACLSDWAIITPVGQVTPRTMTCARVLRERKDEVLALLRQR